MDDAVNSAYLGMRCTTSVLLCTMYNPNLNVDHLSPQPVMTEQGTRCGIRRQAARSWTAENPSFDLTLAFARR